VADLLEGARCFELNLPFGVGDDRFGLCLCAAAELLTEALGVPPRFVENPRRFGLCALQFRGVILQPGFGLIAVVLGVRQRFVNEFLALPLQAEDGPSKRTCPGQSRQ